MAFEDYTNDKGVDKKESFLFLKKWYMVNRFSLPSRLTISKVKVYESIYYRRDADDSFLLVLISPNSEKGNGYLRVGNNFWVYRRNTRTTNSEGNEIISEETLEKTGIKVYQFEVIANTNDVTFPKFKLWITLVSSPRGQVAPHAMTCNSFRNSVLFKKRPEISFNCHNYTFFHKF